MKDTWIIFDIDGTLADNTHRQHHLNTESGGKKDWEMFFGAMGDDLLINDIYEMYKHFKYSGYKIAIITGRSEDYSTLTRNWLQKNGIEFDELYMRKSKSFAKDYIFKKEIVEKKFKDRKVLFAIDDTTRVVEMFRECGITCLQCKNDDKEAGK